MPDPEADRRENGSGRRESDRLFDTICNQISDLRDDWREAARELRRELAEVSRELRSDLSGVGRDLRDMVEREIEKLDATVEGAHDRITKLQRWQIEEETVHREKIARSARRTEWLSKWGVRFGIFGSIFGVIGVITAILVAIHVIG